MRYAAVIGSFVILLALDATAQDLPKPSPRHIEVPDPGADAAAPAPAPAPEGEATEAPTDPAAVDPATAEPPPATGGGGAPRRGKRELQGVAPAALSGRYEVVQVTEAGDTEDFRLKMDRAGRALNQDCITVALLFDFGGGGATLPNRVRIIERQECYKGGLGRYANELAIEVPVTWSKGEGGSIMTVPEVRATAGLVRLRKPESDDLQTFPQWLGPESKVDRPQTDYKVLVELPRRGKPEDPPEVVHLAANQVVLHLEPKKPGGPFQD